MSPAGVGKRGGDEELRALQVVNVVGVKGVACPTFASCLFGGIPIGVETQESIGPILGTLPTVCRINCVALLVWPNEFCRYDNELAVGIYARGFPRVLSDCMGPLAIEETRSS